MINRELVAGQVSVESIANQYGLTGSSIRRHTEQHLRVELAEAADERGGLAAGLLAHLDSILTDLASVRSNAKLTGNGALLIKAASAEGRMLIEVGSRLGLAEELVATHDEAVAVVTAMRSVLPRHPEIAQEFKGEFEKLGQAALARAVASIVDRRRELAS
ncbi:MAG: hypothetical protein WCP28_07520 [Actinomycetes bacterium]